ncbi:MAG: type I DNA topoisomerase [Prevotellaceae bacterium]|jgi:DNA topoisomerase-1|nr:type I DNA topoisomerase [Prevotellaceae bacterium]
MQSNLVIVESPAKAKTIQKFLGKNFAVTSSMGHIRDLTDKSFEGELSKSYKPKYVVIPEKEKMIKELKKLSKNAEIVWLATDEDREGEAIAWHLFDELQLTEDKSKRIAFHEITQEAIQKAVETPRTIDMNLVDAQQARRVLDRIVGFELSPILWRKIKPQLSAGRVQSVTVRLVVEREREIHSFKSVGLYKTTAFFLIKEKDRTIKFKADLKNNFTTKEQAKEFLEKCKTSTFKIEDIETSEGRRSPAAPFTTSTLQQEASRKFGFPVATTMRVAQNLYEAGKITYMRTDSVNLSELALNSAKKEVLEIAGEKYYKRRQYQTKSKGAQEAHEAIRPAYISQKQVDGTAQEKKLYELIWKRTLASQMAEAIIERTNVTISISNSDEIFVASGEVIRFDGFLRVYIESDDNENEKESENILPALAKGQILTREEIISQENFTKHIPRYNEAMLVRKLEELGIGRPSTYAPTISTIQNRGYVKKQDITTEQPKAIILMLKENTVKEEVKPQKSTVEKGKLTPTDIGMVVNDFLTENFPKILNYNFTATVEQDFDDIAAGKKSWIENIISFYDKFHPIVIKTSATTGRKAGEREIGIDPKSGKPVLAKIGRYGAMIQIGETSQEGKPQFASLQAGQSIETITLKEALELFKFPMNIGKYKGEDVIVATGRFGPYMKYGKTNLSMPKGENILKMNLERAIELLKQPRLPLSLGMHENDELIVAAGRFGAYIKYGKTNVSIPKGEDPYSLTKERAVELLKNKDNNAKNNEIKVFENENIKVLNGRYGAYISHAGKNYKIPKDLVAEALSVEQCQEIIKNQVKTKTVKKVVKKAVKKGKDKK